LRFFSVPNSLIFFTPHAVDKLSEAASRGRANRQQTFARAGARRRLCGVVAGKLGPKKRPLISWKSGRLHPRAHLQLPAPARSRRMFARARRASRRMLAGFVNQSEMRAVCGCRLLALPATRKLGAGRQRGAAAGLPCVMADTVGCAPDLGGTETGGVRRRRTD
jgi:hypothetical protein